MKWQFTKRYKHDWTYEYIFDFTHIKIMQNKTHWDSTSHSSDWQKSKSLTMNFVSIAVEQQALSYIVGRNAKSLQGNLAQAKKPHIPSNPISRNWSWRYILSSIKIHMHKATYCSIIFEKLVKCLTINWLNKRWPVYSMEFNTKEEDL